MQILEMLGGARASGRVECDPALFLEGGTPSWIDVPSETAPQRLKPDFNIQYELVRATESTLRWGSMDQPKAEASGSSTTQFADLLAPDMAITRSCLPCSSISLSWTYASACLASASASAWVFLKGCPAHAWSPRRALANSTAALGCGSGQLLPPEYRQGSSNICAPALVTAVTPDALFQSEAQVSPTSPKAILKRWLAKHEICFPWRAHQLECNGLLLTG